MPFIEIHVKERLDPSRSDWFQGMKIEAISPDETRLSGEMPDRSALYGLIAALSSLGLTLISVDVADQCRGPETHLSN